MSANHPHNFPKLHNAAWPGVVGKGPDSEPPIDLDTMVDLTAAAEVDGQKFEGIDLFLCDPHVSIDIRDADLLALGKKIEAKGLKIGSLVAPVWPPTGGGAAMDPGAGRGKFLEAVEKACKIGANLRRWGFRPSGVIRIDSATGVSEWAEGDSEAHTQAIADTFRQAAAVASQYGESLAAEGEICWGGMHSWKKMVRLLELADKPNLGFQADMAHTLLYTLGYNAPEDRLLPEGFAFDDPAELDAAYQQVADALRPWTIDFHVAQNDATVFGSGSHDKTGRHCQVSDPNGKLDIVKHAGFWLRNSDGNLTRRCEHICWDGCMFPNAVMHDPKTWNDILGVMVAVRDAHGWSD
ncbi:MAG: TIM barrel protein [Bryobacterales bacterium]|nr:TIM barrel protein [Bryobacterales bacterium]